MYVIPILTYGAPVWFTGIRQKGLINTLQTAQNEGIRKITGVFRTTPTAVSENMIGIAPIKYLLPRILHSFRNRLSATNPYHILHNITVTDQCVYWRLTPPTNLTALLHNLPPSSYTPILSYPWNPSNVSFSSPIPPPGTTTLYYIPSSVDNTHIIFLSSRIHSVFTLLRAFTGTDHIQALGRTILAALRDFPTITSHFIHTPLFEQTLTSLKPHRDSLLYSFICNTFDSLPLTQFSLHQYYTRSKDSPSLTQQRLWNQ